jgi:hypothetical protein
MKTVVAQIIGALFGRDKSVVQSNPCNPSQTRMKPRIVVLCDRAILKSNKAGLLEIPQGRPDCAISPYNRGMEQGYEFRLYLKV